MQAGEGVVWLLLLLGAKGGMCPPLNIHFILKDSKKNAPVHCPQTEIAPWQDVGYITSGY